MNKKNIITIGILLIILAASLVFLNIAKNIEKSNHNGIIAANDAERIKKEYESLNGTNYSSGISVSIDKDNPVKYSDYVDIMSKINNKESFVLYLGYNTCPWCRRALPVLIEASKKANIDNLYYINITDDSLLYKEQKMDNGYDSNALKAQQYLVDFINTAEVYSTIEEELPEEERGKHMYTPTVVFVKEGKIEKYNVSTVASHTNVSEELTKEQHNELINIYLDGFKLIK